MDAVNVIQEGEQHVQASNKEVYHLLQSQLRLKES